MQGALHTELWPRGCVCPCDGVPADVTTGTVGLLPGLTKGCSSDAVGRAARALGGGLGTPGGGAGQCHLHVLEVGTRLLRSTKEWVPQVLRGPRLTEQRSWLTLQRSCAHFLPDSHCTWGPYAVLPRFHPCCFVRVHPLHGTWAASCGIREIVRVMRF